jgi:hypothetical protein
MDSILHYNEHLTNLKINIGRRYVIARLKIIVIGVEVALKQSTGSCSLLILKKLKWFLYIFLMVKYCSSFTDFGDVGISRI